mmetsp:Transcript_61579/g.169271  ORF Transcript_61579/g.169271 Transcript_61579/m.169271 type:complete len:192 (-) Transcript_61579:503-1078(-)
MLPCFAVVMFVRRIFPPVWYCVPTGSIMVIYLVDKLGLLGGCIMYQALRLVDVASFAFIRHYYTEYIRTIFTDLHRPIWWLPQGMRTIWVGLDQEWGNELQASVTLKQALAVLAFTTTWYMDDEEFLYFFACRTQVAFHIFAVPFFFGMVANIPDLLVRARVTMAVANAAKHQSSMMFWDELGHTPWYVDV